MVLILHLSRSLLIAVGSNVWPEIVRICYINSWQSVFWQHVDIDHVFPYVAGEIQFVDALSVMRQWVSSTTFFVVFTTSLCHASTSTRGVVITGALFSLISALPGA